MENKVKGYMVHECSNILSSGKVLKEEEVVKTILNLINQAMFCMTDKKAWFEV